MPELNDVNLGLGFSFDEAGFNASVEKLLTNAGVKFQDLSKSIVATDSKTQTALFTSSKKRIQSEDELLKKQSEDKANTIKKQLEQEKQYGANVGALKAKHLKENKDLEIKQSQDLANLRAQIHKQSEQQIANWRLQFNKEQNARLANEDKQSEQKRANELKALRAAMQQRSATNGLPSSELILAGDKLLGSRLGNLPFKEIESQYSQHTAKLAAMRYELSLKRGKMDTVDLENAIKAYQHETAIFRSEYTKRNEVIHKGAGAVHGILGIGRELIGGNAGKLIGTLGGATGIAFGLHEAIKDGIELTKVENAIASGFTASGVAAKDLNKALEESNRFTNIWGAKLVISDLHMKELVRDASLLGGFTGRANEEMVKMAAAIESQTGGLVTGEQFIRAIALKFVPSDKGATDTLDRLTNRFPALAAAVKGSTDQYDLFNRVVAFGNTLVKKQEEYAQSSAGRMEAAANRGKDALGKVGQGLLGFVDDIGIAMARTFGTSDVSIKVRIITEDIKRLEEEQKKFGETNASKRGIADLKKQLEDLSKTSPEAAKAVDLYSQSLKVAATDADIAAAANKNFLDSFDTKKIAITQNENEWIRLQLLRKGINDPVALHAIDEAQRLQISNIKSLGTAVKEYNDLNTIVSKNDPSQEKEKTKDLTKSQFEKAKALLEDQMKGEQSIYEIHGIDLQRTKEQIEIGLLNIQIKYENLIAERAKKGSQLQNQYLLQAAKDKLRITEIHEAEHEKVEKIWFDAELILDKNEFSKQRIELEKKFREEKKIVQEGSAAWFDVVSAYLKQLNDINEAEHNKELAKVQESEKKKLEIQRRSIDERLKHTKDNISKEVTLENERYDVEDKLRENNYRSELKKNEGNDKALENTRAENLLNIESNWYDHQERLKKIGEDANKDIVSVWTSTGSNIISNLQQTLFKPLEDEYAKTKNIALGAVLDIGKGFVKLLENKAIKSLGDSLNEMFETPEQKAARLTNPHAYTSPIGPTQSGEPLSGTDSQLNPNIANATITITNATISGGSLTGNSSGAFGNNIDSDQSSNSDLLAGWGFDLGPAPKPHKLSEQKIADRKKRMETDPTWKTLGLSELAIARSQQGTEGEITMPEKTSLGHKIMGGIANALPGDSVTKQELLEQVHQIAELLHVVNHAANMAHGVSIGDIGQGSIAKEGDGKGLDVWGGTDLANVGKTIGSAFSKTAANVSIGATIGSGLISALPNILSGLGNMKGADSGAGGFVSLATSILPFLFSSGGTVPEYFTGGGLVKFKSKGTDTVPAMLTPHEGVLTAQQNKDLRLFASNSGFSGGSRGDSAMIEKLIQSNHAIGNAIDGIEWKISGNDLRGASNRSYSDTIGKKMA